MRSKLFVSALMVALGLGSLNVRAIAAETPKGSASKVRTRKPEPPLSGARQLIRQGHEQQEQGNPAAAIELFNKAVALAQANNQRALEARAIVALGDIYGKLKKPQEAIDFYRKAVLLHQSIQKFNGAIDNLFDILDIHIKQKRIDLALAILDEIENLIPKLNTEQKLESLELLSRRYQKIGRFDRSLTLGQKILDLTHSLKLNPSQKTEPETNLEKDDDDSDQASDQDSALGCGLDLKSSDPMSMIYQIVLFFDIYDLVIPMTLISAQCSALE